MSAPGFTPGPWHTERPFGEPGLYVAAKSSALVAKVYEERDVAEQRLGVTADANAALLAAAPDLYAALRETRAIIKELREVCGAGARADICGSGGASYVASWALDAAYISARAALAKAEGRA